jgi:hypothetical protein
MADTYELIDELSGLLEKAIKTKPKDVKQRADLHKKSNAKVKELQQATKKAEDFFAGVLDESKEALYAALGIATSEVRLRDREVVRGLKQATKSNEAITRPKGWKESFDKAFKIISEWDPKAPDAHVLDEAVKLLKAAGKSIDSWYATYKKEQQACNAAVKEVVEDLKSINDDRAKGLIQPYIDNYYEALAIKPV